MHNDYLDPDIHNPEVYDDESMETDWSNINFKDEGNHELQLIDGLSFRALFLEINCNIPDINAETVRAQFELDLQNRITEARGIFRDNLQNIVRHAQKERAGK